MALRAALKLGFVLSATDKMSRTVSDAVDKSTNKLNDFQQCVNMLMC